MLRRAKNKEEPFDYVREQDALRKHYNEVIDKAEIGSQIERCERRLERDYFEDKHLPPFFTKAGREARKLLEIQKFRSYRRCMRDAIFAVKDSNLREELISTERKFHKLKLRSFENDLSNARGRLNSAGNANRYGSFFAAAGGVVIVVLGWQLGGAMGGTAAAVFALIMAMYGLHELEWVRRRNVERATAEVADLEATINEIVEQEIFIQVEEDTGERDEEFTREEFTR